MIIVRLKGGLGNQMFQYAIGRTLAYKNNDKLALDLTPFLNQNEKDSLREYSLSVFNINAELTTLSKIGQNFPLIFFLKNISYVITKIKKITKLQKYIREKDSKYFQFQKKNLSLSGNTYLNGYWQNEKYFKDIEHIIRQDFTFKNKPDNKNYQVLDKINATNSVSLHIRRGDYVNNYRISKRFNVLSLDYYKKAINLVFEKINSPVFFVFSNDIPWVKENLNLHKNFYFIDHNQTKDYEDLRLMSNCKHHIIANSTFSWWGAWLSENDGKIVIAPKQWLTKEGVDETGGVDIVPNEWIKL